MTLRRLVNVCAFTNVNDLFVLIQKNNKRRILQAAFLKYIV